MKTALAILVSIPLAAGFVPGLGPNRMPARINVAVMHHIEGQLHEAWEQPLAPAGVLSAEYRARWAHEDDSSDDEACVVTFDEKQLCGAVSFDSAPGGMTCIESDGKWHCV